MLNEKDVRSIVTWLRAGKQKDKTTQQQEELYIIDLLLQIKQIIKTVPVFYSDC